MNKFHVSRLSDVFLTLLFAVVLIPINTALAQEAPENSNSNSAPVANDAQYTILRNNPLWANVTASDVDPEDTLEFSTTILPTNGMLDLKAETGQFFYFSNYNFVGDEVFKFVANDGQTTSQEGTVTITVNQGILLSGLEENLTADFAPAYDPQNFENLTTYINATFEEPSITFRPFVNDERVDEIEITNFIETQIIAPGSEVTFNLPSGTNTIFYFTPRSQGQALGQQYVSAKREGPPLDSLRVDGFEFDSPFDPKNRYYSVSEIPFETQNVSLFVESTDPAIAFIRINGQDGNFIVTRASDNLAEPFILPIPSFEGNYFSIETLDANEISMGRYDISFFKKGKTLTGITENLVSDFNPSFSPNQRWYSLNAGLEETEVSVGISSDDPAITGFRVPRGGDESDDIVGSDKLFTVPLNFGWSNYLNIQLYSGDEYVGSYYLNVYRKGPPLTSLRVDGFEFDSPFNPENRYYSVSNMPFETENVSLFVESTDPAIAFIRIVNGQQDENFIVTRASDNLAEPFVLSVPFLNGNYFTIETLDANEISMGRYDISFFKKGKTLTGIIENLESDLNPSFSPDQLWYSLNAGLEETEVSVGISSDDPAITGFRVLKDGKGGNEEDLPEIIEPGQLFTVPLNFGWSNYLSILLYAGDEYVGSYYLNIYREGPPLTSLRVDGFEFDSPFDPKNRYYSINNMPFETENVSLFVESTDPAIAFIQVINNNNESFYPTRASDNLAEPFVLPIPSFEGNYFSIDTLDANEISMGRYDISFFKKEKMLTGITENLAADLDPLFDPNTRDYSLNAGFEEAEVSLGINSDDPNITGFRVTIYGKDGNEEEENILEPGQLFTVPLNFGDNSFGIQLYAGDEFVGSYYLYIYRQGLTLSSLTEDVAADLVSNSKDGTAMTTFQPEGRDYYLLMLPDENTVTFSLKPGTLPETGRVHVVSSGTDQYISPNGTITINAPNDEESDGVNYSNVDFELFLNEDPDSYVGKYTVYIEKFAATLDGIAEDDPNGDIIPVFNPAITEYTLRTALETEIVRFTPTAQNPSVLSIETYVYGEDWMVASDDKIIAPGETLEVTLRGQKTYVQMNLMGAENIYLGSYRVTIEKVPSSISALRSLVVDTPMGISPVFTAENTGYTLDVGNTVAQIRLSPVALSATAKIRVNGTDVTDGTLPAFPLSVGANIFSILVTAQDEKTTTTYTLTVNRAQEGTALGGGRGRVVSPSRSPIPLTPAPVVLGAKTQLYPEGTIMKVMGYKSKYYLMKDGQKLHVTPFEYKKKYSKLPVVGVKKKILNQMPTLERKKTGKM